MGVFSVLALALVALPTAPQAAQQRLATQMFSNPIRKVVNMLQTMQAKVTEEGEKEKMLYDKFMCYCSTNDGELANSIASAEEKVPALGSSIQTSEEQLAQTQESLKQAQTDRSAATATISEASVFREREAAAYAAQKDEYGANGEAITKAIEALEKGMSGSFLQTSAAQVLKHFAEGRRDMFVEQDRQDLLSFLGIAGGSEYVPSSGEVTGILKEMGDEVAKGLAEATAKEEASIEEYEVLMAAKKREVAALTASIESKMTKIGELSVEIVQMKNDLTDTQETLLADKAFLAELKNGCKTKTAEWQEREQTRSQELLALAETIKTLNDDSALNLFKEVLPSSAASFVQVAVSGKALRAQALAALRPARGPRSLHRAQLDLIALALHGKKIGFEKVLALIDEMVATLKKEQVDDESEKEYCSTQLDLADDKKKVLERSVSDEEAAIARAVEGIATLKEDISALEAGIKKLDTAVSEATVQRQEEHKEYQEAMASDTAAKELLTFAKERLNKFYNPQLAKPSAAVTFVQVAAHRQKAAPPPPPETFGAYTTKSEENAGVIQMINILLTDLEKDMTMAETEEKDAQADYEALMKDSAVKRTGDAKSLTQKENTKAELEEALESSKDEQASASAGLASTLQYIYQLHTECDFLLKYFEVRKAARTDEIDALGKAKAVLSGADFSLLQVRRHSSMLLPP